MGSNRSEKALQDPAKIRTSLGEGVARDAVLLPLAACPARNRLIRKGVCVPMAR